MAGRGACPPPDLLRLEDGLEQLVAIVAGALDG